MSIQKNLRPIILIQILLPIVLLVFGIYHGLLQLLFRSGVVGSSEVAGIDYYQGLTAHGVINALVLTTYFAVGFGNAFVSQSLGLPISRKVAWTSLLVMTVGAVMTAVTIFMGEASVLYTFYPPLKANPFFYIGLTLFVVGSWIAFWAWIPVYLRWRRENPGKKTPLSVVGIFVTFIIWQTCTLPVAYEILVLLLPWSLGWVDTVNVLLARTLFWFFGHPLVYFWLLPTYVMYYVVLPKVTDGKLFSDFAGRFAFLAFVVLSAPLGLHHQFSDPGISQAWKGLHAVLTSLVAIPSMMTAFTVAASLEFSAKKRGGKGLFAWWAKLPYFNREKWIFPYFMCGLVIFIFGGMTGVVNASFNVNNVIHNTIWVPAHFHMTVGGPVFLGILGMSLLLAAGLSGKAVRWKGLAVSVPYLWVLGILVMSGAQFYGSLSGEPRRTNMGLSYTNPDSPLFRSDWWWSSHVALIGGVIMVLAMIFYFACLGRTLMGKSSQGASDQFQIPEAEPLHDENIPAVKNFFPYVIASIVLIVIAYTPPLVEMYKNNFKPSQAFEVDSPLPVSPKEQK